MRFFKLPATLRWVLVNCMLLWIMMTVYRMVLTSLLTDGVISNLLVIGQGALLDFGVIAIPGILYTLCSLIPYLHPYKSRRGILFGLIFFCFFGFVFAIVYGLDLLCIKMLSSRISGKTLQAIMENPTTSMAFRKGIPYMALITGVTLLVWVWWLLIEWLHKTLGAFVRAEEKSLRLFWQSLVLLVFCLGFLKAAAYTDFLPDAAILTNSNLQMALTANPVLTLLFK